MRTLDDIYWSPTTSSTDPSPLAILETTPDLANLLCLEVLRANTDASRWSTSLDFVRSGSLTNLRSSSDQLIGEVKDNDTYTVGLRATNGSLEASCDCSSTKNDSPKKLMRFCPHAAALGLAVLGWQNAPESTSSNCDIDLLSLDDLRLVVTKSLESPTLRRSIRAQKLRAGLMEMTGALAGEYADFGVGVPPSAKIWVSLSHLIDAIAPSGPSLLASKSLVDILFAVDVLIDLGARDDGSDTSHALDLLHNWANALSDSELFDLGYYTAKLFRASSDTWGWPFGSASSEVLLVVALLGPSGRRGLFEALTDKVSIDPPHPPRAPMALPAWENEVAEHQRNCDLANNILGLLADTTMTP